MVDARKDTALASATTIVDRTLAGDAARPTVRSFFDEATFTASHVVHDPATKCAAIVDSVLDYDPASGRISYDSANLIVDYIRSSGLKVQWLLETHAHADHLSAAPYLQQELGGKIAIGKDIVRVQQVFGKLFNAGTRFAMDGSNSWNTPSNVRSSCGQSTNSDWSARSGTWMRPTTFCPGRDSHDRTTGAACLGPGKSRCTSPTEASGPTRRITTAFPAGPDGTVRYRLVGTRGRPVPWLA